MLPLERERSELYGLFAAPVEGSGRHPADAPVAKVKVTPRSRGQAKVRDCMAEAVDRRLRRTTIKAVWHAVVLLANQHRNMTSNKRKRNIIKKENK